MEANLSIQDDRARAEAEAKFKRRQDQEREASAAMREYRAGQEATLQRMAKLRAERLAREATGGAVEAGQSPGPGKGGKGL